MFTLNHLKLSLPNINIDPPFFDYPYPLSSAIFNFPHHCIGAATLQETILPKMPYTTVRLPTPESGVPAVDLELIEV
jgi:hypothetical protein